MWPPAALAHLPYGRHEWRTYRPGLRLALDLLTRGEYDGFIPLDLDRAFRDPRDLEDLIDITADCEVRVDSVTGSLKLSTEKRRIAELFAPAIGIVVKR